MKKIFSKSYILGVKAGAVAGLVYGLILSLLILLFKSSIKGLFLDLAINRNGGMIPGDSFFTTIAIILPAITLIAGMLYGLIFVYLINILPSDNIYLKSITLSSIFWLRTLLKMNRSLITTIVNLIIYLLIGAGFAYCYIFFAKRMRK